MRARICLGVAVTWAFLWHTAAVVAQATPDGVQVVFSAEPSAVAGGPVIAQLTIRNGLLEPVEFDLGPDRRGNLRFRITDPDGVTKDIPPFVPNGFTIGGRVDLAASRTFVQPYVLNESIGLDRVGTYRVQMMIVSAFRTKSGISLAPQTNHSVEIVIKPRNANLLRESCERFAEVAVSSKSAETQINAGRALRYFVDPGAVSCLGRVARATTDADRFIIAALLDIGTIQAQDVLLEMFRTTNDSTRFKTTNDALGRFVVRP